MVCSYALWRVALRYHKILERRPHRGGRTAELKLSALTSCPADFAKRYGTTAEAMEEWKQHWLRMLAGQP